MSPLSSRSRQLLDAAQASGGGPTAAQRRAMKRAVLSAVAAVPVAASAAAPAAVTYGGLKVLMVAVLSVAAGVGTTLGVRAVLGLGVVRAPVEPPVLVMSSRGDHKVAVPEVLIQGVPEVDVRAIGTVAKVAGKKVGSGPAPGARSLEVPDFGRRGTDTEPQNIEPNSRSGETSLRNAASAVAESQGIGGELEALARVAEHLDANDSIAALSVIARYREMFSTGVMKVEIDALEVRALCGVGRTVEAQLLASALMTSHASNPIVQRLRGTCAVEK